MLTWSLTPINDDELAKIKTTVEKTNQALADFLVQHKDLIANTQKEFSSSDKYDGWDGCSWVHGGGKFATFEQACWNADGHRHATLLKEYAHLHKNTQEALQMLKSMEGRLSAIEKKRKAFL